MGLTFPPPPHQPQTTLESIWSFAFKLPPPFSGVATRLTCILGNIWKLKQYKNDPQPDLDFPFRPHTQDSRKGELSPERHCGHHGTHQHFLGVNLTGFTHLVPFLLGTEYGRRKSSLLLLMTQRSMLLPDPKSLKMPAEMASLTSFLASSS